MLTTLFLAAAVTALPPLPPGLKPPSPKPLAPKYAEHLQSLGTPMAKTVLVPTVLKVPIQGFVVTNITVANGQVTLGWQDGQPVFQAQGQPTLLGPWSNIGIPTTAPTKTFPIDQNRFFRVVGSNYMQLSITHTNPTTLTWVAPEIDMSDSLTPFLVKRSSDGGATFVTVTPTSPQVNPIPATGQPAGAPGAGTLTLDDPTPIGSGLKWEVLETTANGVVVPYNVQSASSSSPNWAKALGGTGTDSATAVAVDASGNVYVVGYFCGTVDFSAGTSPSTGTIVAKGTKLNFPADMFIAKYSSIGTLMWVKGYGYDDGGTFSTTVTPQTIAIDSLGNIFVGGNFSGTENFGGSSLPGSTGSTAFIVKYNAQGAWQWDVTFGSATGYSQVTAIAFDSQRNVLLTGAYQGLVSFINPNDSGSYIEAFLIKMANSNASIIFARGGIGDWSQFGGANGGTGLVVDNRIDPSTGLPFDTIYLIGTFTTQLSFGTHSVNGNTVYKGFLVKFPKSLGSTLGNDLWVRKLGAANADDAGQFTTSPTSVALDLNGGPCVCGSFIRKTDLGNGLESASSSSGFLVTYSGIDGSFQRDILMSSSISLGFSAVSRDSSGKIFVIGSFNGTSAFGSTPGFAPPSNGFVAAYSPAATTFSLSWYETLANPNKASGFASLVVDSQDYAIVVGGFSADANNPSTFKGQSFTSAGLRDVFITRLNQ